MWWCKIKTSYFLYESVIDTDLSEILVYIIYMGA